MAGEHKSVHIKIPKKEFKFMKELKTTHGISLQDFITKAIQEKISNFKKST